MYIMLSTLADAHCASGGRGLPRPHANKHPGALLAVRHVSVAHQPLRLEERACFSSLSPSADSCPRKRDIPATPHHVSDTCFAAEGDRSSVGRRRCCEAAPKAIPHHMMHVSPQSARMSGLADKVG